MDLSLRKTYRKQLTLIIKEAEVLMKEEDIDVDNIPVVIARVKAIRDSLDGKGYS